MNTNKKVFYLQKYTKGLTTYLTRECILKGIKLNLLQTIFKINPKDADPIVRDMIDCYEITLDDSDDLIPYIDFKFDFDKYTYQTGARADDLGNTYYIISEFHKIIPRYFVEECILDIPFNQLREIFKNETYDSEPNDYGFAPYINLDPKYADALQPYSTFKIDLENFDFWIEKLGINEPRYIGQPGEEFVG